MFDQVWSWAGKYRTTEKNIGTAPELIPIKLMQLFHDVAGDYTELIAFTKEKNKAVKRKGESQCVYFFLFSHDNTLLFFARAFCDKRRYFSGTVCIPHEAA